MKRGDFVALTRNCLVTGCNHKEDYDAPNTNFKAGTVFV